MLWNHQGTQDTLSKVLINLASGSLLTVLVLYLVLYRGLVCGHSRLYSSRRCENKGENTRYWEKYGRRGCANFYHGEAVQTPFISPSRVHAWSPTEIQPLPLTFRR
jgi:hypothetical protein